MKKHFLILLFCLGLLTHGKSQQLFHQDVFYGGVTAAGYSTGIGAWNSDTISINIEPGSTIRNAWMFLYTLGDPPEGWLFFDNNHILHESFTELIEVNHINTQYFNPIKLYILDIKNYIDPSNNDYSITLDINSTGPELNWGWWCPIVYVEYENPSLDKVSTSLWYNDLDMIGEENYNFNGLNNIDFNNDMALSLFTDRIATGNPYDIFINNNQIGEFNQIDSYASTPASGVQGHFYYQNEELFGLGDDVPNTTMYDSDAIALLNNYLNVGDNSYSLDMENHVNPSPDTKKNINILFSHAYTTPCDTFSTSITPDTSICRTNNIQLFASGGTSYEWLPADGLSDPTSATPMASPDSTQLYVVRIENQPGCYRTEKVLVEVRDNPIIDSLEFLPEICGESNGKVTISASGNKPLNYTLDGITQTSASFSDLLSDNYMLTVIDENGCTTDSSFSVPQEMDVEASFIANPESGYEPLNVQYTNTTQNATDFEWYIDDAFWDNTTHTSAYFDTAGVYNVMLYAYNNIPECQDSFALKIIVEDTMTVRIPNVFTPNNDNSNDLFTIDVRRAKEIKAVILNRWGNVMHETTKQSNGLEQTITIWNGETQNKSATEGTYFYKFEIKDVKGEVYTYQGFVQLVRD